MLTKVVKARVLPGLPIHDADFGSLCIEVALPCQGVDVLELRFSEAEAGKLVDALLSRHRGPYGEDIIQRIEELEADVRRLHGHDR